MCRYVAKNFTSITNPPEADAHLKVCYVNPCPYVIIPHKPFWYNVKQSASSWVQLSLGSRPSISPWGGMKTRITLTRAGCPEAARPPVLIGDAQLVELLLRWNTLGSPVTLGVVFS